MLLSQMEVGKSIGQEAANAPDSHHPPSSLLAQTPSLLEEITQRLPRACTLLSVSVIFSCATWALIAQNPDSLYVQSAEGIWTQMTRVSIPIQPTYPLTGDSKRGRGLANGVRTRRCLTTELSWGHRFSSEVILLAVDMPDFLDAPMTEPSGMAVWFSFGTLMAEAAARYLQISPDEVQVGVRPMRDSRGLIQGEVFIYDNVPGGAGYARAIQRSLSEINQIGIGNGTKLFESGL